MEADTLVIKGKRYDINTCFVFFNGRFAVMTEWQKQTSLIGPPPPPTHPWTPYLPTHPPPGPPPPPGRVLCTVLVTIPWVGPPSLIDSIDRQK